MVKVCFHETAKDDLLRFAVIVSKYRGKWVFCKHKDRTTYECPGGHREPNEPIDETAKRELWEETGALKYHMKPICPYSVQKDGEETFGMLFFAELLELGELPPLEIEKVELFDELPQEWTYPEIQPLLVERIKKLSFIQ